jgi:hypothetical protein
LGGFGLVDGNPIANGNRRFTTPSHTLIVSSPALYWIEIVNHPL